MTLGIVVAYDPTQLLPGSLVRLHLNWTPQNTSPRPVDIFPLPLDVNYEVYSPQGVEPRVLTTRAASTLVLVNAATQKPRRISEAERAAWSPYLEDPVVFTARR